MKLRLAAALWAAVVILAGGHLAYRFHADVPLDSDVRGFLVPTVKDDFLRRAEIAMTDRMGRRFVLLIGHDDAATAGSAARRLVASLVAARVVKQDSAVPAGAAASRVGRIYFPYRAGLLSAADRLRLHEGRGEEIAQRALARIFGFAGLVGAQQVRADPFLLLPDFFAGLPSPVPKTALADGMMMANADGKHWAVLSLELAGGAYALEDQKALVATVESEFASLAAQHQGLRLLRLGAVFFAHAGATSGLNEATLFLVVSVLGVVLVVTVVFRALRPLILCTITVIVGILCAASATMLVFPRLHVMTLMFGASLVGVTVDYAMHFCCESYTAPRDQGWARLRVILPGLLLGAATTFIGYAALFLAPFSTLHQVAAFSLFGVVGAFATVVLWLPYLTGPARTHWPGLLTLAERHWKFWMAPSLRGPRRLILGLLAVAGTLGLIRLEYLDDIRVMQSLSPRLVAEQAAIGKATGISISSQFFLVRGRDHEQALQRQEALLETLRRLKADGALDGFTAAAQFVPSQKRQQENRDLIAARLEKPFLARHLASIGLSADDIAPPAGTGILTIEQVATAIPALALLIQAGSDGHGVYHAVTIGRIGRVDALARAAAGIPGVHFIDPAADFSRTLADYRRWAVWLVAISAVTMAFALGLRYGWFGGIRVMVPPLAGVVLAPAMTGLIGGSFTFFDAIALILVLSIGVDYAVFCAETTPARRRVTLLAVGLAASTTILSFGMLSHSSVYAVHSFGATMLLGIGFVMIFAPAAAPERQEAAGGDRD